LLYTAFEILISGSKAMNLSKYLLSGFFFLTLSFAHIDNAKAIQETFTSGSDSEITITGEITDKEGNPLYLAHVKIVGTTDGGVTKKDGRFRFSTRLSGPQTLSISMIGFQTIEKEIILKQGQSTEVSVELKSKDLELGDLQVTGSSFTTGDGKGVTLNELEVVTTPGAAADIFRAIQTFPGVSGLDEGAGLLVRGGDVDEVKVFLDQATVVHPFRFENPSGGVFGSIPPFLVSGTFFSSGGFPARYGDALSGVLAMESLDMPGQTTVQATASFAATSAGLDIPVSDKLGIRFSGNRSFTEFLFSINGTSDDFTESPAGYDGNLSLTYKPRSGTQIKLFNFGNTNRVGVRVPQSTFDANFRNEESNRFHNLQWTELMGDKWLAETSISWNAYNTERSFGGLLLDQTDHNTKWRTDLDYNWSERLKLRTGAETEYRSNQFRGTIPVNDEIVDPRGDFTDIRENVGATRAGAWSELSFQLLPDIIINMGVRSDFWSANKEWIVDPRLNVNYKPGPFTSFSIAVGRYRQFPEPFEFNSETGNPNLHAQQAWHYIGSAEYKKDLLHLRGELYYKDYENLVIEDEFSNLSNRGHGFASGVDLFAKYSEFLRTRLNGWISYSFLRSDRFQPRRFADGLAFDLAPSDYALTHNLSVVTKYRVWNMLTLGATYRMTTGRPFTPVIDAVFNDEFGFFNPVEGPVNSRRLPQFRRLDVDLSYFWMFSGNHSVIFFMSVSNALDRANVTDITYNEDFSERRFIRSNFERFLFLGATLNLEL
jgi:hypothetical protein